MDPVTAIADLGGAATLKQLQGRVSRRGLARAIEMAQVVRPFPGTYTLPSTPLAVAAAVHHRAVIAHSSAATLWGCDSLHKPPLVHLVIPRKAKRRADHRVAIHYSDLSGSDQIDWPWPMTSLARTVIYCCRSLPLIEAVVIGDSAFRLGATDPLGLLARISLADLRSRASSLRGPGATQVRQALDLIDPAAESVLESVFRVLVWLAGFPPPHTQARLFDGRIRVDFYWPDAHLVVEVEGYEFHSGRQAWRDDCRRFNDLVLGGYRPLRFTWEDVLHNQGYVVRTLNAALGSAGVHKVRQCRPAA